MPAEPTDADLVTAVLAGDETAFPQLYLRYRVPVTRFVARTVGDAHLAEDLVQEAFVKALRTLGELRDPARFRSWLFSIAHRGALDHVRKGGPVLLWDLPETAGGDETAAAYAAHEAEGLVWDAAASLEPRQLAILELTVRDEVSNAELAQALDVGGAHAAVLAHRARSALGHAVRLLLLARNPRRCPRLAGLVPDRPRRLSRSQRASVDRHLRRCPQCRDVAGRLTAPLAVFGVLLVAAARSTPTVQQVAVAASSHLLRKSLITLGLTASLTVAWWAAPNGQDPPPVAAPPPLTTTREVPIPIAPVADIPTTTPPPPTTTTPPPTTTTTKPKPPSEADKLISLLNERRAAEGCAPLRPARQLTTAAKAHSTDMRDRGYIALTSPDGTTLADRVRATGYRGMRGAYVQANVENAADVVRALVADDTPALSCEVDTIGTARADGGPCGHYWTVVYGQD